mgnify:CR=1 FL=1
MHTVSACLSSEPTVRIGRSGTSQEAPKVAAPKGARGRPQTSSVSIAPLSPPQRRNPLQQENSAANKHPAMPPAQRHSSIALMLLQEHHQHRHIRGRHPRNPARRRKRPRTLLHQLLPRFNPKPGHFLIRQILRQQRLFHLPRVANQRLLSLQIALVLHRDFRLLLRRLAELPNLRRKLRQR